MARIVVLEFSTEEQSDQFIENMAPTARLVGKYYMPPPNLHCRCPAVSRLHIDNWRRHKKFGLFVCRTCKKPSKYWRKGALSRLQEALGTNLLDSPEM